MLLNAVTATGAGNSLETDRGEFPRSVQVIGNTTAGAGSAVVDIQVSNDGTNWLTAFTVSLTLSTAVVSDGQVLAAKWNYLRANVTTLTGTGANVSAIASI